MSNQQLLVYTYELNPLLCIIYCLQNGWTALHLAAQEGRFDVVRVLTNAKAQLHIKTEVRTCIISIGAYQIFVYIHCRKERKLLTLHGQRGTLTLCVFWKAKHKDVMPSCMQLLYNIIC